MSRPLIDPWRIRLTYLWRHGRLPALGRPRLFTELVQHRKLRDRDVRLPLLADKVSVKAHVAALLGQAWIIPTLWHGPVLPATPPWPAPFVVKSRHGCRQTIVVRDRSAVNWATIRARAQRWTSRPYGRWLDEWLYRHIPRGVLVEPYLGVGPTLPIDYKFYVFAGRVEYIQVHLGRSGRHRWIVHDRAWRRLSGDTPDVVAPPASLARMIAAAETLAATFDFVRVDLYEIAGRPLFGEMTFYPGSGLDRFDPVSLDRTMGDHWLRASAALRSPA